MSRVVNVYKLALFIEIDEQCIGPLYLKVTREQEKCMDSDAKYKNTIVTYFRRDGCSKLRFQFNTSMVVFPESLSRDELLNVCAEAFIRRRDELGYPIEDSIIDLRGIPIPMKK